MRNITGGCHCGAIRYQVEGELIVHALCHCTDCRRHAGAPMVALDDVCGGCGQGDGGTAQGLRDPPEHGRRHFCADCGTGLFYTNANVMPGIIDIQSATYDDPDAVPAMVHIQTAERLRLDGARARTARLSSAILRENKCAIEIELDLKRAGPSHFAGWSLLRIAPQTSRRNPQARRRRDR